MPRLPVPKPLSFLVADKQKDLTELAQALGKLVPTQNGWGCHSFYDFRHKLATSFSAAFCAVVAIRVARRLTISCP